VDPSKIDLSKLSKAEKLELLDLLERKETLKKKRRDIYTPHDGQRQVHKSRADERFVFAGNGSGKTTLGVNEVVWAIQGYNPILDEYTPVPARVYIVLDKPEKVSAIILPELRKWMNIDADQLHKNGKPYISSISFPNGSLITFLFFDQDPLAAEGLELDYVWIDEPCPRQLFISLKRGGRTKGRRARYLLTGTPIAAAWLRQDIYEKWVAGELPNAECFRFSTEMNAPNLDEGYIGRFSAYLSEKERRIRLDGEFFDLDGLALAHLFNRKTHIIPRFEWPREWPVVVAIDPHPRKRHFACMLGVDPNGQLYYIKEIAEKAVARDFAKSLHKFMTGFRVVDIVCDSLGSSEMTGGEGFQSFIDVLRDERVQVRPTRYDEKQDEAWIERIQTVLAIPAEVDQFGQRRPGLLIMEGSPGIVADVENVQWLKMRGIDELKPKLDISNKDYLSTLKYALAGGLAPNAERGTMFVRSRPVTAYGQNARPIKLRRRRLPGARR
jgi:hypothetical protein